MKIKDSVTCVTGANRGLDLEFSGQLLTRGAKKVYAGTQNKAGIDLPGVTPIKLVVTDPASVAWSYTNSARVELRAEVTQVLALHVSFMETDMTKGFDMANISSRAAAVRTLAALQGGLEEIMADASTERLKKSLSSDRAEYLAPRRSTDDCIVRSDVASRMIARSRGSGRLAFPRESTRTKQHSSSSGFMAMQWITQGCGRAPSRHDRASGESR